MPCRAVMYVIHQRTDMIKIIRDIRLMKRGALFILISALSFFLSIGLDVDAGVYLGSAHGDSSAGVNRSASGFPTDYPEGFCAHCHEQHASIGGSEPDPSGGPSGYMLFYDNHTSYSPVSIAQTDNFCFQCHAYTSSLQSGARIRNLTYSYRVGRWVDSVNGIFEVFSYDNLYTSSNPGTSHDLDDISTFIATEWSHYTSNSNPCVACHNPHAAQGDPIGSGAGTTAAKTTVLLNRGWPVSRPSLHNNVNDNTSWGLWGDGSGENMSDYAASYGSYQAPYKYGASQASPAYEPDGSSITNGSNLADYVTFCSDCHNDSNTIYSTTLSRNLYKFGWADEKHGGTQAVNDIVDLTYAACDPDDYPCPGTGGPCGDCTCSCPDGIDEINDLISPYDETTVTDYVLACTDCHEPHGSPNLFMIRRGVNGGSATTSVTKPASETPDNTKEWKSLCGKCHDTSTDNNKTIHHRAYTQEYGSSYMYCIYCHEPDADDMRNCLKCHYHGNTDWPAVSEYGLSAHPYNTNEKMF